VDSIINGLVKTLNHRSSSGAFFPDNFDPRRVNYFSHGFLLVFIKLKLNGWLHSFTFD
jgi:hypothetical protein